jgi:hypothetical protein
MRNQTQTETQTQQPSTPISLDELAAKLDKVGDFTASMGGHIEALRTEMATIRGTTPGAKAFGAKGVSIDPAMAGNPGALKTALGTNGFGQLPGDSKHPLRFAAADKATAVAAVAATIGGKAAENAVNAGLPQAFGYALALESADDIVADLVAAKVIVLPEPAGFVWEWYHVVGVGLLCSLVGVGGVIIAQQIFSEGTTVRTKKV